MVTEQNPMDGHLFLFRGRGGDRLKILYWDRTAMPCGTSGWRKASSSCRASTATPSSVELRASELAMMLDGIDLRSIRRVKRYSQKKSAA